MLSAALALACGDGAEPGGSACGGVARSELVNGSARELFLGLSDAETRAIVLLEGSGDDAFCSGTVVADGWVLTAAHCTKLANPEVSVAVSGGARLTVPVLEAIVHPSLDAALFRSAPLDDCAKVEPLPAFDGSLSLDWVGTRLELAGYGLTENAETRRLRFLVESITAVEPEFVILDGAGRSGACIGDSGGPLLLRNDAGKPSVAGVLTTGSSTCVDRDRFVRVDAIRDWLDTLVDTPASSRNCGAIPHTGACVRETAVWCGDGGLEHERCGEGFGCGWDRTADGFRCVRLDDDPCEGAGSHGACVQGEATVCEAGMLERTPCAEAGLECRYSPQTGRPACVAP